jgi:hypothetical protein
LASQTTAAYQSAEYELVPSRTGAQRTPDCSGDAIAYSLTFENAALRKAGADNPRFDFFVPVDSQCPISGFVAVRSPSGTVIEPKVTRDQALRLVRDAGDKVPTNWPLSRAYLYPREGASSPGWNWNLYYSEPSTGGDCWRSAHVVLDAETGAVLSALIDTACS